MGRERERRFLIVVGEASGDRHAGRLVRALREIGHCRVRGVAGPALREAGVESVIEMESLAVLGFSEVVSRLPTLLRARRTLLDELRTFAPHAVLLVDYPGFNLRLGPQLKARGARVFYYIAPQVWAWHPERAGAMAKWVDELAVVFPFEEALFRKAGVNAHFVGHPLLEGLEPEVDEAALRDELGAPPSAPLLGLLPGSRAQEMRRHVKPMLQTAARLQQTHPDLVCAMPLAGGLETPAPVDRAQGVQVLRGRTHAVQAFSTACVVSSGTATLETALFGTPLAIVYRVGALNFAIASRVVHLERIGLPNIVCGEDVAPEFIQSAFRPDRVAEAVSPWISDSAARVTQSKRVSAVRERLGGPGASARAARRLWDMAS